MQQLSCVETALKSSPREEKVEVLGDLRGKGEQPGASDQEQESLSPGGLAHRMATMTILISRIARRALGICVLAGALAAPHGRAADATSITECRWRRGQL